MCDPVSAAVGLGTALVAKQAFKPPSLPAQQAAATTKATDPQVQAKRQRSRSQQLAARGLAGTQRTGAAGLLTPASTAPKTLLGQ